MSQRTSHRRQLAAVAIAGAVALAGLVGCGSDNKSGGSAGTAGTTGTTVAQKPTGTPIKIGTVATVGMPIGTFPESFAGVKAAAQGINAAGGIDGHPLVVETCNGKFDPNQELACARKLVGDGVVAMIGAMPLANVPGYEATLIKGHVVDLASNGVFPQSYEGPNVYPIDFLPGQAFACADGALAKQTTGTDQVRVIVGDSVGEKSSIPQFQTAAKNLGSQLQEPVLVPQTATDLSPIVQQMANRGKGLVSWFVSPPQTVAFVAAAASAGQDWAFCSADGIARAQRIKLGAALKSFYVGSGLPSLSEGAKYPLVAQFNQQIKALVDSGDQDAKVSMENFPSHALRAWLGVQAFKQIVGGIHGPITAPAVYAATAKAHVDLGGTVPPLDFSKPVGTGAYPRVFNPIVSISRWDPAKQDTVPVPGLKPIDGVKALQG